MGAHSRARTPRRLGRGDAGHAPPRAPPNAGARGCAGRPRPTPAGPAVALPPAGGLPLPGPGSSTPVLPARASSCCPARAGPCTLPDAPPADPAGGPGPPVHRQAACAGYHRQQLRRRAAGRQPALFLRDLSSTASSSARYATTSSADPARAGLRLATASRPAGTGTTSPPPAKPSGRLSLPPSPRLAAPTGRRRNSDYLLLRRRSTTPRLLPVLARPAETRQHSQFYLLPTLSALLLLRRPRLWLSRPAETRQPPYFPSPPASPGPSLPRRAASPPFGPPSTTCAPPPVLRSRHDSAS